MGQGFGWFKQPEAEHMTLVYDDLTILPRYLIFHYKNKLLSDLEIFVKFQLIIFL